MKAFAPLQKHGLPVVAVLAGVTAASFGFGRRASTAHAEPQPASYAPAAAAPRSSDKLTLVPLPPDDDDEGSPGQSISGEVLEQIDVEKYSYLRLGETGSPGTWAAVPRAPSQLGKRVTVSHAEVMTQFASATLKRTFETIYFGVLDAAEASSAHALGVPSEPSPAAAPPAADYAGMPPHPGAGPSADRVAVGQVKRAAGPLARTVVELNASRPEAAGGKARVRAVVVKSTSGVMGRTFLHVRDGSGEASTGTNDLVVTTAADAAVGVELVLEGTLEIDRDFGSGYRYRVLLADAVLVAD